MLVEYFTNNATNATISTDSYLFGVEEQNELDLRSIHYHTSSPAGDPLHAFYTSGPLAREFFYSISGIPYALINGKQPLNLTTTTNNQILIDRESLEDPLFDLNIVCEGSNTINVSIEAEALQSFSNLDLILHCAIVQKEIDIANAPSGVTRFNNVLREFLPDPGGSILSTSMNEGDKFTTSLNWSPPSSDQVGKSRVVVFVQNINTRQIYQSGYFDLSNITSSQPMESTLSINLYPNPTSDHLWVESPVDVDQIMISDLTGRLISVQTPSSQNFSISLVGLNSGVYIISLKTSKGDVVKKIIKQ